MPGMPPGMPFMPGMPPGMMPGMMPPGAWGGLRAGFARRSEADGAQPPSQYHFTVEIPGILAEGRRFGTSSWIERLGLEPRRLGSGGSPAQAHALVDPHDPLLTPPKSQKSTPTKRARGGPDRASKTNVSETSIYYNMTCYVMLYHRHIYIYIY